MMSTPDRILILDDDPRLRKTLADILRVKGYEPISFGKGQQALELIAEQEIAVALIDLRLEDMPGLEVLGAIKERSPGTQCILLTGHASQDSAIEAVNAGAYSYFQKPFDIDRLLLSIQHALDKRDISQVLKENEERYRDLIENIREFICTHDLEGRLLSVNQAAIDLTGYTIDEMLGQSFGDFLAPESARNFAAYLETVRRDGVAEGLLKIVTKSGGKRIWQFHNTLRSEGLAIPVVRGYARDITEQWRAETALRESEELYRTLFDQSAEAIYLLDPETRRLVNANPRFQALLGYSSAEITGLTIYDLVDTDKEAINGNMEQILAQGTLIIGERQWRRKDRSLVDVYVSASVIESRGRALILIVASDISESKQAREALATSEERYRGLFESARDALLILDGDLFIAGNPAAQELYGVDAERLLGKPPYGEFSPPKQPNGRSSRAMAREYIKKALSGEAQFFEWLHRRADGSLFDAEVSLNRVQIGAKRLLQASVRDISERKQLEAERLEAEIRYRSLFDQQQDAIFIMDLEGCVLIANQRAADLLGYRLEEIQQLSYRDYTAEEPQSSQVLKQLLDGEHVLPYERLYRDKVGAIIPVEINAELVRDAKGRPLHIQSTVRDITERKANEAALIDAEAKFRLLVEQVPAVVYTESIDGRTTYVSPQAESIIGYSAEAWIEDPDLWRRIIHPDDQQHVFAEDERTSQTGEKFVSEYRSITPDGRLIWLRDEAVLTRDEDGTPLAWQGVMYDITERKLAEQALKESELRYQALAEISPVGIFRTDAQGLTTYVNPRWCEISGLSPEAAMGTGWLQAVHPEDREKVTGGWDSSVGSQHATRSEYRFLRPDGTIAWVMGQAAPEMDAGGKVSGYVGTITDITDRRQAEEALRSSEARLRALFNAMSDVIIVYDAEGRYLEIAPTKPDLLYKPPDDLLGRTVTELLPGPTAEQILAAISQAIETQQEGHLEYELPIGADTFWFDAVIMPIEQNHVLWVARDITGRKNAEEEIRRRATDLEVLYENSRAVNQLLSPEELADRILELLGQKLAWHHAVIRLYDPQKETLKILAFSQPGLTQAEYDAHIHRLEKKISKLNKGLSGWVFQKGENVRSGDVRADPRYIKTFPEIRSGLYVPLQVGERVIGSIAIESVLKDAFSEQDERLLATIAAQAAVAIENTRQYQQAVRMAERNAALHQASQEIVSAGNDLENVYLSLHHAAEKMMPVDNFTIVLADPLRDELQAVYLTEGEQRFPNMAIPAGMGYSGHVIRTQKILWISDSEKESDLQPVLYGGSKRTRSILAIPLQAGKKVVGALSVQSFQPGMYTSDDLVLLETLASEGAIAIENARLFAAEHTQRQLAEALRDALAAGASLSATLDFDAGLDRMLAGLERVVPFDGASLMMLDRKTGRVRIERTHGYDSYKAGLAEQLTGLEFDLDSTENLKWMAEHRQPMVIPDVSIYPGWVDIESAGFMKSWAGAPVVVDDEVIAFFSVDKAEAGFYKPEHAELLKAYTGQATLALQNARLFEETRRRLNDLEILYESSLAFTQMLDPQAVTRKMVELMTEKLGWESVAIRLLKKSSAELELAAYNQRGSSPEAMEALASQWKTLVSRTDQGMSGWVFQHKQSVRADDVKQFPQYIETSPGVQSGLYAPLMIGAEVIGVIAVESSEPAAFSQQDENLLNTLARQAAIAIHNAGLYQEAEGRAGQFASLYEITHQLSGATEIESVIEIITRQATALLNAPGGEIYLFHPDCNELEGAATSEARIPLGVRLALGEGASGRAAQSRQPVLVDDYSNWEGRSHQYDGIPFSTVIAVPMLYSGELLGVISVFHQHIEGQASPRFSEEDSRLLSLFASAAAGAVYSARLLMDTRRRAEELSALTQVSAAMRKAQSRAEMLPVILDQVCNLFQAGGASLAMRDPLTWETVIELGYGKWAASTGTRLDEGEGISGQVIQDGLPYVHENAHEDPLMTHTDSLLNLTAVACVPLTTPQGTIGCLWIGRELPINDAELDLLTAIANISANAIQRTTLHEKTEQHVGQLAVVADIGRSLSETLELEQVYKRLALSLYDLLPDICGLFISLYDPQQQLIHCASGHFDGNFIDPGNLPSLPLDASGKGHQSQVILDAEPLIVNDLQAGPQTPIRARVGDADKNAQSAIYVPMNAQGKVIGLIQVQSYRLNRFSNDDIGLLTLVANTAAVTIENARLFSETQQRLQRLYALHAIDLAISASVDLRVTLNILLDHVMNQLNADAAAILLFNPGLQALEYISGRGFNARSVEGLQVRMGSGLAGQIVLNRRMLSIPDLNQPDALRGLVPSQPSLADEGFQAYHGVPLVSKGRIQGVLEIYHRSAVRPDSEWLNFLETLAGQAAIAIDTSRLFDELQRSNFDLMLAYDATIQGWSQAMDARDKETEGHTLRVTELTLQLAQMLNINEGDLEHLRRGAMLHDIGKIAVPDNILHKTGPLTDEEWDVMRQHPVSAYEMLVPVAFLRPALDIPYCHHEKWDGSGYPRSLSGEQIPLAARIFAIIDVWDALISDRPYRKAWSKDKAIAYIREQSGTHFDPRVVDAFILMQEGLQKTLSH
ncbi:MAG: PAS domain S-box protein [Chloroflexota bacterium]